MKNNKNTLKCALFDLDGVVFDTESQYSVFWGGVFRKYYPETEGLEQKIKGQTLVQIYDGYFKDDKDKSAILLKINGKVRSVLSLVLSRGIHIIRMFVSKRYSVHG